MPSYGDHPAALGPPSHPGIGATSCSLTECSLHLQTLPERTGTPPQQFCLEVPCLAEVSSWEFLGGQGNLWSYLSTFRKLVLQAFDLGRLWAGVLFHGSFSCSLVKSHLCAPGCDGSNMIEHKTLVIKIAWYRGPSAAGCCWHVVTYKPMERIFKICI